MAVSLDNVSFAYGGKPVLKSVSLTFPERGAVCLFGASGGGKTTILRLLAGLEKPDTGRVTGLEGKRLAMVFQEDRLLPWLSALDNVAAALTGPDAKERATRALERVGLSAEAQRRPASFSGGMKRRVAIARALAAEGDILLLDEPFSGLDEKLWGPLAGYIAESCRGLVVLVTHIREEAARMGAATLELPALPVTGALKFTRNFPD